MDKHDERGGQGVFERVEKGEDAEGDLEAERERDDTTDVHEGGDSVVQEGKHHDERAGPRPKPGRVDLQDTGGYDKPVAAKVVLHRSLVRLSMEGTVISASKLTSMCDTAGCKWVEFYSYRPFRPALFTFIDW